MVHSNVWVSPIFSMNGDGYYVHFVNEFSNWIYFLKSKASVYKAFMQFKAHVEQQIGYRTKVLQSD